MNLSAHTLGPLACLVMPGGDPALLHALLHGEADSRQHRSGKAFGTLMSPLIKSLLVGGLWTSADSRHNLKIVDREGVLSADVCSFPPAWLSTWLSNMAASHVLRGTY